MEAVWYDRQGPAADVLVAGELPDPEPAPGEVRVRLRYSGINPGDTKKRRGWLGSAMPYPRVVPHSDGSGVVDRVGEGVDRSRLGRRVWVYGAQSYRPFGTAAQCTVVPDRQAVDLPAEVDDRLAACLGIPGLTAHRAVFADGPVAGQTVLVHGALGAVGSLAAQLAHRAGAHVITTVRREADLALLTGPATAQAVSLDGSDPAAAVRSFAPGGVDRVVEVSLSDNVDLDVAVVANDAVIAAYATRVDRTDLPFWPLLFANVSLRLVGSDDVSVVAKQQAAAELTAAARDGDLVVPLAEPVPLAEAARAHEQVDRDNRRRTVLVLPD
jgi:NADPH2:quinone reductase